MTRSFCGWATSIRNVSRQSFAACRHCPRPDVSSRRPRVAARRGVVKSRAIMRAALAEFIGTFFLVFAGTGAIVVNQSSGGVIGHVGIAIVFGLVVFSLIQAFGDVSGAHFNPAVTLAFATAG